MKDDWPTARSLRRWCSTFVEREADEWLRRLAEADVIAGPVNTYREAFRDPQVLHNQMIVQADHGTLGRVNVYGIPVKLTSTPGEVRRPYTRTAQPRDFAGGGYGAEEIGQLIAKGITAVGAFLASPPQAADGGCGCHPVSFPRNIAALRACHPAWPAETPRARTAKAAMHRPPCAPPRPKGLKILLTGDLAPC
jgi:hypothetical protein